MIEKILKIEEVGRLQNTGGTADNYRLTRETMIYAGNTHGKSTFTAILRSAKENDENIIKSRLTFGSSRNPLVSLRQTGGANVNFNSHGWSTPIEEIRIFDDKYIRENFFSPDEEINDAGQKTIETFILGAEGKELARNVADLTKKQTDNNAARSTITRQYTSQHSSSGVSFSDFLVVENDVEINEKIKASEERLKSFQNQTSITRALANIKNILQEYLTDDHRTALSVTMSVDASIIAQHIKDHMKDGTDSIKAKQYIADGLSLQKSSDVCVFCSQQIRDESAKSLVDSYQSVFSQAYLSLVGARNRSERFFGSWNPEMRITTEIVNLQKLGLDIDTSEQINNLKESIEDVKLELELKKNTAHQFNLALFDKLKDRVAAIDAIISPFIEDYDKDLSEEANKERGNLAFLKLQKERFEQYWTDQCGKYKTLQSDHDESIKPVLDATIEELKTYAETLFANCMETVNDCLASLGVNFKIKNLQYKGRSRSDLFSLVFDEEHEVGIRNSASSYSTRHTLSESDKRALCFAFFIGSVQHERNLGNIIILMDDPASSFDWERRTSIAGCLRSLMDADTSPAQLLLLTHDRDFAKTINSKFNDSSEYSSLILEWDASRGTSDFKNLDATNNHLFMSDFYKNLDKIHQYISLTDSELDSSRLQLIRHLLENLMKKKYYDKLRADIRAKGSIEAFITTLSAPGMPYENRGDLVNKIRGLSPHTVHHDQDNPGGYDPGTIGPTDVRNILQKALEVLEEI